MLRATAVCQRHSGYQFGIGKGTTGHGRTGGGRRGDYRNPDRELLVGGAFRSTQKVCKGRHTVFSGHWHFQYRSDMMYDIAHPCYNNVAGAGQLGDSTHAGGILKNLYWGVRFAHPHGDRGIYQMGIPRRRILVRYCKWCYYWTDGFYHYNFCTRKNIGHWHRKECDQNPAEGYRRRPNHYGRVPYRQHFFQLPIFRLGSNTLWKGRHAANWGNPKQGLFHKWLVLRRFAKVGRSHGLERFGSVKYFHREL
eukprot:TRINITY_DN70974_c0_g1_i1.p1 TRINITY_DN70974_c0_g1~~TRINITY_DN70974_c0_g1_i1.p1  ORF type:complete len:251 (+),score=38.14 TRINITY_DN70974_c0_g1_i1:101-853(+)